MGEVLITLGVIGVVAALTVPTLISKYQEKEAVTKVIQAYSLLNSSFERMIADESTVDKYGNNEKERMTRVFELLPNYLKVNYVCKDSRAKDCMTFPVTLYYYNDYEWGGLPILSGLKLSNGMTLLANDPETGDSACIQTTAMNVKGYSSTGDLYMYRGTHYHGCGAILVDINGNSGPNVLNRDIFTFKVVKDGVVPAGSSKETIWTETFDAQCLGNQYTPYARPGHCAAWVIQNKNMDYLHCPEKLGWDKAHSCKD